MVAYYSEYNKPVWSAMGWDTGKPAVISMKDHQVHFPSHFMASCDIQTSPTTACKKQPNTAGEQVKKDCPWWMPNAVCEAGAWVADKVGEVVSSFIIECDSLLYDKPDDPNLLWETKMYRMWPQAGVESNITNGYYRWRTAWDINIISDKTGVNGMVEAALATKALVLPDKIDDINAKIKYNPMFKLQGIQGNEKLQEAVWSNKGDHVRFVWNERLANGSSDSNKLAVIALRFMPKGTPVDAKGVTNVDTVVAIHAKDTTQYLAYKNMIMGPTGQTDTQKQASEQAVVKARQVLEEIPGIKTVNEALTRIGMLTPLPKPKPFGES
jgi:hypothetical protein